MSFDKRDYPEFAWSMSRHNTFNECKRKYCYHYYVSHNGWDKSSSDLAKAAYKLKKITNLSLLLGELIHNEAKQIIYELRKTNKLLSFDEIRERIRQKLNQAYKTSKNRIEWEQRPSKSIMLHEIYYDGKISTDKIANIKSNLALYLNNLLTCETLSNLIKHYDQIIYHEIDESLQSFDYNGTKLYVRLDLLYQMNKTK